MESLSSSLVTQQDSSLSTPDRFLARISKPNCIMLLECSSAFGDCIVHFLTFVLLTFTKLVHRNV